MKPIKHNIVRDLSWLAFNARVLQEAKDKSVHVYERLRFLGIFSNNLDEFFRVRVATLSKMIRYGDKGKMHHEDNPQHILDEIQSTVIQQQAEFDAIYAGIITELNAKNVHIKNEKELSPKQRDFVATYFSEEVRTQLVPLMIESMPQVPLLGDKSIYLACVLGSTEYETMQRFALIEIPTKVLKRFIILPSEGANRDIILLEDIIRYNLPNLFAPFGFNRFMGSIIKVTRDSELEIDNDVNTNLITEIEKGLKNRKKGLTTRFIYDRNIDPSLLDYLVKRLGLSKKDNMLPGGRIHNFKDFMNFPKSVFPDIEPRNKPFVHPLLLQPLRIMKVLEQRDVMLHFPYHSFDSIIDLLRESAIDPFVQSIKITAYRLAKDSKIANALINAVRNGKEVIVYLELRARFDEEANLKWKEQLEENGVKVFVGVQELKVHAKLCVIKKREFNETKYYAFISTGNLNEHTAQYYSDHCLLTTNLKIIADINRVFTVLEQAEPKASSLKNCKTLACSPVSMRRFFISQINKEIHAVRKKKNALMILKMNSLVDGEMIDKIYDAARAGVKIDLVIRGINCALTHHKTFKRDIYGLSVIDEYLEHARVFYFQNDGHRRIFISSADWMVRNLDHRIEVACPVFDKQIQDELYDILRLQVAENIKGRILDNHQVNDYAERKPGELPHRSQIEIHNYLIRKVY